MNNLTRRQSSQPIGMLHHNYGPMNYRNMVPSNQRRRAPDQVYFRFNIAGNQTQFTITQVEMDSLPFVEEVQRISARAFEVARNENFRGRDWVSLITNFIFEPNHTDIQHLQTNHSIIKLEGRPAMPFDLNSRSANVVAANLSQKDIVELNQPFIDYLKAISRARNTFMMGALQLPDLDIIKLQEMNTLSTRVWFNWHGEDKVWGDLNVTSKLADNLRLLGTMVLEYNTNQRRNSPMIVFDLGFDILIVDGDVVINTNTHTVAGVLDKPYLLDTAPYYADQFYATNTVEYFVSHVMEQLHRLMEIYLAQYSQLQFSDYNIVGTWIIFQEIDLSVATGNDGMGWGLMTNQHLNIPPMISTRFREIIEKEWFTDSKFLPPLYHCLIHKWDINYKSNVYKQLYNTNCWTKFVFRLLYVSNPKPSNADSTLSFIGLVEDGKLVPKTLEALFKIVDPRLIIRFSTVFVNSDWMKVEEYFCKESDWVVILFADVLMRAHLELTTMDRYLNFKKALTNKIRNSQIKLLKSDERQWNSQNWSLEPFKDWKNAEAINIFIDIETLLEGKRECYLVCAYYEDFVMEGDNFGMQWLSKHWRSMEEFMQWLLETPFGIDCKRVHLWAHNGAKFDFIYMLPYLSRADICGTIHNLKQLRFESATNEFITYDFFLTFSMSLDSLGKLFKIQHQKEAKETMLSIKTLEDVKEHWTELINYCVRDCVALKEVVYEFKKQLKHLVINPPPNWISVADLASKIYSTFQTHNIYGLFAADYPMFKEYYFGGYTMVFGREMTDGYAYDINSSYPYIMTLNIPVITSQYPVLIACREVEMNLNPKILRYYHVVSYDFGEEVFLGPFPTRRTDGNWYFKKGEDTWVWDHMLVWLLSSLNNVKIVVDGYYSFEGQPIYKKYVEKFYELKNKYKVNKEDALCQMCKLLLNSLYGKTGQEMFDTQVLVDEVGFMNMLARKGPKIIKEMKKLDKHYLVTFRNDSIHPMGYGSLVYIANFITSYARLRLFQGIIDIKSHGGEVYYCDTDSIYCSLKLSPEYLSETELGKWKCEKIIKRGKFFGSKCYIIEEDNGKESLHLKGIAKSYMPSTEEIWKWNTDEELQTLIETTWNRKFGFVENKSMQKRIRTTLTRRIYKDLSSLCL